METNDNQWLIDFQEDTIGYAGHEEIIGNGVIVRGNLWSSIR